VIPADVGDRPRGGTREPFEPARWANYPVPGTKAPVGDGQEADTPSTGDLVSAPFGTDPTDDAIYGGEDCVPL
jgi:hypothetical protein